MPIARVEIGGRIARIEVPEGTTPEQAKQMAMQSIGQQQAPKDNSRARGFLAGALKPLDNLTTWAMNSEPFKAIDRAGVAMGLPSAAQATAGNNRARQNNSRTGYQLLGNIAGTLPTAYIPGGVLAQGAAGGALLSDNPNDLRQVARDAAIGAVAGKVGQQVGARVIAPIAERVGRTAPARTVAKAGANVVNQVASRVPGRLANAPRVRVLPNPKFSRADRAVGKVTPELSAIRQNVQDAADLNLPYALADAHPKLQALAGSVVRHSPDAKTMATRQFNARADDKGFRAIQGVNENLTPSVDVKQVGQDLMRTANAESRPLYEQSFQGGSIAPLESQLADAFNQTSKAVATARAELAAAQRTATQTGARVSRAGENVYMNANALPVDRQAKSAIVAAEQRLAQATGQHEQVLGMLRTAQSDAASNAPGAVWNPRIQQFLDDPISKQGMARGLEIQRLEALAEGKPFNPTEYGVTGFDEAGAPIVSNVPNMRLLDAVKKGMDAIIDDYPKDFKGQAILDERGRAITQVLKQYRGALDDVNPTYGEARGVYQGYARQRDALNRGFNSAGPSVPARDLENIAQGLNPEELGQFRSGYATNLTDQIANQKGGDPYNLINGGLNRPAKITALFPEGAPRFNRLHELEDQMTATQRETLGGSQTQSRNMADQLFQNEPANMAMDAGVQALTGGGVPGVTGLIGKAAKFAVDRRNVGLIGAEKKATEMAPSLLDTSNPKAVLQYLDDLVRKQAEAEARRRAYEQAFGTLSLPATALGNRAGS